MWLLPQMLHPFIGPFIFRILGLAYYVMAWGLVYMQGFYCLEEPQAVVLIPCKMSFQLYGKVVVLHLDSSTAKAYLCNQGGTVSLFLPD